MKKYERDGKIAVVVAPKYGHAFVTEWNEKYPQLKYDPVLVEHILNGVDHDTLIGYIRDTYPEIEYFGDGILGIQWVPRGVMFQLRSYDGAEWAEILDLTKWEMA